MLIAALRDLQWRRRRFIIAILGTAVVFAMTLVLTGLSNGFQVETRETVDSLGIDTFIVKSDAAGPFVGSAPFSADQVGPVAQATGRPDAVGLVYSATLAKDGNWTRSSNLFGAPASGPGMPHITTGRAPSAPNEVAVSSALGRDIGDDVVVGSRRLRVVGIVEDSTALAHQPNLFFTVAGAQQAVFSGQPLVSSIGLQGPPVHIPDGYRAVDRNTAVDDLLRPLKPAYEAIRIIAVLLWIVAAAIVGSVIYISALERVRDFAVFKAVGASTRSVLGGLVLQSVLVAVIAAACGALLSVALTPLFPMRVAIPASAFLMLPAIAIVIGLLASGAGLRRAVNIDPATAFGGP
ncbi:MAG: ABC transporter permease [Candidatus Sericytochromatia bacterium]